MLGPRPKGRVSAVETQRVEAVHWPASIYTDRARLNIFRRHPPEMALAIMMRSRRADTAEQAAVRHITVQRCSPCNRHVNVAQGANPALDKTLQTLLSDNCYPATKPLPIGPSPPQST
jgi:hypothetical protein